MKHDYKWLRKEILYIYSVPKIDAKTPSLTLERNKVLNALKKSDEELQQLKQQIKEIELCQNCTIIDEVLGENQE